MPVRLPPPPPRPAYVPHATTSAAPITNLTLPCPAHAQASPRAGHSAKNVSDLIYERHQERLAPGCAVLATASLKQPAGRPSGEALLSSVVRGGLQDGGAKPQGSRKAEAEAKHAARLASTGTGARAAAMAALRASRRAAAVRPPAARAAAHDSASQTAAPRVRDNTSQTGFESADSVYLHNQPSAAQPAARPPRAGDAHAATLMPNVPRQNLASDESSVNPPVPDTAAVPHGDPHGPASSQAPLSSLTLSSPPRRGREPPSSPPQTHSDLALQMGLPPSPQLPARHRSGVPQLSRGKRSADALLALPAATAAVAVAAVVGLLPSPSQPQAWKPLVSPAVAGSTDSVLLPAIGEAVTSKAQTDRASPAISDSTGNSPTGDGGATGIRLYKFAAGQTALPPGVGGHWSITAAAQEGLGRYPAASHTGAQPDAAPLANATWRSRTRPDLVSDIEALRRRWGAACDPTAARQRRAGDLDDYSRRPLSRLFGRLHSGDPALAASPADWPRGSSGVGNGATYSPLGVLPPPGVRHDWGGAPRGLDLRGSYPGGTWIPYNSP